MTAFLLLAAAADPAPVPTGGTLRPGLEPTDVSPGLLGFLVTFAVAAAVVVLFLFLTRSLRRARRNAEDLGIPVERKEGIAFRREDGELPGRGRGGRGGPDGAAPDDQGPDAGTGDREAPRG